MTRTITWLICEADLYFELRSSDWPVTFGAKSAIVVLQSSAQTMQQTRGSYLRDSAFFLFFIVNKKQFSLIKRTFPYFGQLIPLISS